MAYHRQPLDVLALPTWQAVQQHRQAMQRFSMRDAFAANPRRFEQFSLSSCGLFLDYSKNLASDEKSPAGKTDYHTMGACYEVLNVLRPAA